jgi:vacuolar-type H+-ATPase subunit B/Vma2
MEKRLPISLTLLPRLISIDLGTEGSMTKKDTLNLRVSAEFKRRLVEEARKENRSVTNYLETTLTKIWRDREPTPAVSTKSRKGDN